MEFSRRRDVDESQDRDAILKRRKLLIAAAFAGLATTTAGCEVIGPTACLDLAVDSGVPDADQSDGDTDAE